MAAFTMPLPTLYTYIRDLEIIAGRSLACRNFTAAVRAKEAIAKAMGFRVPKECPKDTVNTLEARYLKAHPEMFCDKHAEFGRRMRFSHQKKPKNLFLLNLSPKQRTKKRHPQKRRRKQRGNTKRNLLRSSRLTNNPFFTTPRVIRNQRF